MEGLTYNISSSWSAIRAFHANQVKWMTNENVWSRICWVWNWEKDTLTAGTCSFPEWKSSSKESRPFSISRTSATSVRKVCSGALAREAGTCEGRGGTVGGTTGASPEGGWGGWADSSFVSFRRRPWKGPDWELVRIWEGRDAVFDEGRVLDVWDSTGLFNMVLVYLEDGFDHRRDRSRMHGNGFIYKSRFHFIPQDREYAKVFVICKKWWCAFRTNRLIIKIWVKQYHNIKFPYASVRLISATKWHPRDNDIL